MFIGDGMTSVNEHAELASATISGLPSRSRGRAIALNAAAQFGSYAFNNILATIVGIIVVRHLGQSEYGVLAFVVAYTSFFQLLTTMGVDTVVTREIARRPA